MYSFKMTGISAEIICILDIIHLSELIFVEFHVVQLVIIKIKGVAFAGYLLKILLITKLVMHPDPIVQMLIFYHMKISCCRHYSMLLNLDL